MHLQFNLAFKLTIAHSVERKDPNYRNKRIS